MDVYEDRFLFSPFALFAILFIQFGMDALLFFSMCYCQRRIPFREYVEQIITNSWS